MPTCCIPEGSVFSLRRNVALARQRQASNFSSILLMQSLLATVRVFSSPAILIVVVWCGALFSVAIGPVDYRGQPSLAVLAVVACGLAFFCLAYRAGEWWFRIATPRRTNLSAPSPARLKLVVVASSLAGIGGIALVAFDRMVLSGVNNSQYAELLRCAPDLVNAIEIRRTPLLYLGYLTFSFGFASLALFLLKGEQIRGWMAVLAQLSILSPIGYAVIYSGRTSVLLIVAMFFAVMIVRLAQRRSALPTGHHLFIKLSALVIVFAIHTSLSWSTRRDYCVRMSGVVSELMQRMKEHDAERERVAEAQQPPAKQLPTAQKSQSAVASKSQLPKAPESQSSTKSPAEPIEGPPVLIGGDALGKMIEEANSQPRVDRSDGIAQLLGSMDEAWHTSPRAYLLAAMKAGWISPRTAQAIVGTYFYATHGVRTIDIVWRERDKLSPNWGLYEIGILSPIMRVFFPGSRQPARMLAALKAAGIYGFYPSVWAAAYLDFGIVGAVIYVLVWGGLAGWSAFGARNSELATPSLLLTFILASIPLSLIQSPLGVSNSALVLASIIVVGLALDFSGRKQKVAAAPPHAEQASAAR